MRLISLRVSSKKLGSRELERENMALRSCDLDSHWALLLSGCVTHIKLLTWPSSSEKWTNKMSWSHKKQMIQCLIYASYSTNIGLCLPRQSHSFFYWTLNQPFFFILSPRRKVRGKISANYWNLSYSRSWYNSLLFVFFTDFYFFWCVFIKGCAISIQILHWNKTSSNTTDY